MAQLDLQARAGHRLSDLARQVRQSFSATRCCAFSGSDVRVMVRYPQSERRTMGDVRAMRVRTPTGAEVPFDEVASVEVGHGFSTIQRTDGQRVVTVSASVDEKAANADEINGDTAARFLPALASDYAGLRYSFGGEQRERNDSLEYVFNFTVALFVIYVPSYTV